MRSTTTTKSHNPTEPINPDSRNTDFRFWVLEQYVTTGESSLYISGPMTGYPEHNFPAFHDAATVLRNRGFHVLCPAEQDPEDDPLEAKNFWPYYMRKDLLLLAFATAIVVLPGWEKSDGARLEVCIGRHTWMPILWYETGDRVDESYLDEIVGTVFDPQTPKAGYVAHKCIPYGVLSTIFHKEMLNHNVKDLQDELNNQVFLTTGISLDVLLDTYTQVHPTSDLYDGGDKWNKEVNATDSPETPDTPSPETVAQEAQRIVYGDRNVAYGHPIHDFARTAKMMSGVLNDKLTADITPEEVALLLVCVKMSRQQNKPIRDNLVDMIGYTLCLQKILDYRRDHQ